MDDFTPLLEVDLRRHTRNYPREADPDWDAVSRRIDENHEKAKAQNVHARRKPAKRPKTPREKAAQIFSAGLILLVLLGILAIAGFAYAAWIVGC